MYNIRNAVLNDLIQINKIETECFPIEEAASLNSIKERIEIFSEGFLIMEIDNKIIGFINGAATNDIVLNDLMFEDMNKEHNPLGKNLVIFGVDISPDFQGKGYSKILMNAYIEEAKKNNRSKIILTCKKHLISYYESFGYILHGLSNSVHGGSEWFDMVLDLDNK